MMGILFAAGAALGAIVVTPHIPLEHRVRIDHASGPINAAYTGAVTMAARQVGAPGPGGRAATLRCEWTASLAVEREASHAGGTLSRRIDAEGLTLTRAGWCNAHRADVARQVAERSDALHRRVLAVAEADRAVLVQQLERQLAVRSAG